MEQDGMEDKPQNYLIAEEQFAIDALKKRLEKGEDLQNLHVHVQKCIKACSPYHILRIKVKISS